MGYAIEILKRELANENKELKKFEQFKNTRFGDEGIHQTSMRIESLKRVLDKLEPNSSLSIDGITEWLSVGDVAKLYGEVIEYRHQYREYYEDKIAIVDSSLLRQIEEGRVMVACR